MQGRTHNCGQLRLANVGEEVKLVGWYENLRKVSKNPVSYTHLTLPTT